MATLISSSRTHWQSSSTKPPEWFLTVELNSVNRRFQLLKYRVVVLAQRNSLVRGKRDSRLLPIAFRKITKVSSKVELGWDLEVQIRAGPRDHRSFSGGDPTSGPFH